jgi:hypothetical protein
MSFDTQHEVRPRARLAIAVALLLALTAGLAGAPAIADEPRVAALGDRGEVYRALTGTYGKLFPKGGAASASTPVLALEISEPGESPVRLLVPGSEGPGVDGSPALVFEADSGTAFVVWESRAAAEPSRVLLAGLRGDEWTDPHELSGDVDPLKGSPQILITRDRYQLPTVADGIVQRNRSVLHAVWWERAGDGTESIQYTPVVLESGVYVGWNPVYRLNDLDPQSQSAAGSAPAGPGDGLYSSPSLSRGKDLHAVMVAFANRETSRLLTVEARVLPGELGLIADRLERAVVEIGYDPGPDRIRSIRGVLRATIIEIGVRFNPGVTNHFAESVVEAAQKLHDAKPHRGIRPFAGDLRATIIEIGVQALGDVDRQVESKSSRVLEVVDEGGSQASGQSVPSVVRLRLVRDLPAPQEPDDPGRLAPAAPGGEAPHTPARIFSSEDGTRLLVSWEREGTVVYTESVELGKGAKAGTGEAPSWTAPLVLEVGDGAGRLSADEVERILRSRVQRQP